MGTAITDIITSKEISIVNLKGKILAVDSYNMLYQFLSTIRQRDGSLLKDSKGRVTSHLTGLFNRVINLMGRELKFVFVFDGKVPELKKEERTRRKNLKKEARKKYEKAKKQEDEEDMKKYASRTSVLTSGMVEQAKKLITALGMPVVQAPSEGEAQAARMVQNGDCYAVLSQDADALIFGAPRVIKNLSITKRRKKANALTYKKINPELIILSETLNELGMTRQQLIVLAMLVGTDYNVGGVKGIGPKTAIKLLKEYGEDFDSLFEKAEWEEHSEYDWKEIFSLIKNMKKSDDYELEWKDVDREEVINLLVKEHDFSQDRVESSLDKLQDSIDKEQKGLGDFF